MKKLHVVRQKSISNTQKTFCISLIILSIIGIIILFIEDSKSKTDGGLAGALAMFILLPIVIVSFSKLFGRIEIYYKNKPISSAIILFILLGLALVFIVIYYLFFVLGIQ